MKSKCRNISKINHIKFAISCSKITTDNLIRLRNNIDSNILKTNSRMFFYTPYYFITNISK